MRFTNRVVVVTGGASGIGLATADAFAAEGARVYKLDINGGDIQCDVGDDEQVRSAMETVERDAGRIDVLVACAAEFRMASAAEASGEDWSAVFRVNVTGVALSARYAAPAMHRSGGGSIVIVGSASGMRAEAGYATYSTSKAALWMLARCCAVDYGHYNIRVNVITPGPVDTPALRRELQRVGLTWGEFTRSVDIEQCLSRVMLPDDIARSVLFLSSDEAKMITGANLVVDGGLLAKGHP